MSLNALRSDYNPKRYRQREELYEKMKAYHDDSFLFDNFRLSLKQHDYYDEYTCAQYVNTQEIYDEFTRIDRDLKRNGSYKLDLILEIMERLLGDRYEAFYRIYKEQYQVKPIPKKRYLDKAKKDLENVLYKYEMDIAIDKWGDRAKKEVFKARWVMINYYRSIGDLELANSIEEAPLIKPKTFTEIAKGWREFHTHKMAKKCKITKKEANKLLQGIIKNIKSDF